MIVHSDDRVKANMRAGGRGENARPSYRYAGDPPPIPHPSPGVLMLARQPEDLLPLRRHGLPAFYPEDALRAGLVLDATAVLAVAGEGGEGFVLAVVEMLEALGYAGRCRLVRLPDGLPTVQALEHQLGEHFVEVWDRLLSGPEDVHLAKGVSDAG